MSPRVKENIHFFNLLLSTHLPQKRALLVTADKSQLDFLSELLHNIIFTLPTSDKHRAKLQRRKYLTDIANIKRSHAFRRQRVKKHAAQLIKLMDEFAPQLKKVLDSLA